MKFEWYEVIIEDNSLQQGDLFSDCPVILPTISEFKNSQEVTAKLREYDVILMTQSCDLLYKKVELAIVCPVWSLNEFEQKTNFNNSLRKALRQGNIPRYHLLNKCEIKGFETDFLVVDFRFIYNVPMNFLVDFANKLEKRIRLLPPYREHLSQAFARYFMRVGLPIDIPPFK